MTGVTSGPHNKGLHRTGRGRVAAARPVVEARPAGEAQKCWADTLSPLVIKLTHSEEQTL
jgi:hypothetical protein